MGRKFRIYVIDDEVELSRHQKIAKKYGRAFCCDICGWKFRVRDIVFSSASRGGTRVTRRCALCYGKAFGFSDME